MSKYREVRQCIKCKKIYEKVPYVCYKCGARLLEDRPFLFEMKTYRTNNCEVVIAKRRLLGWKVKGE